MELKDKFKEIADATGWGINYARRDVQNLQNISDSIYSASQCYGSGETFLFIDPIIRTPHETGITYTGNFMVLTNSPLDMSYEEKFESYIRPLLKTVLIDMKSALLCEYDVNTWRSIEVINFFDFNADGLSINYELKGY